MCVRANDRTWLGHSGLMSSKKEMKGIKWTHNVCTHMLDNICRDTHFQSQRLLHSPSHACICSCLSRSLLICLLSLSLSPPSASFLLTCLCSLRVYLLSLLGILALSLPLPLSLRVCMQRSVGLAHTDRNLTHQLQLASHKHWHTSFTEEVGHFNGNVWSACVYLKWIVTWFLLPGKVYKSLSSSFIE